MGSQLIPILVSKGYQTVALVRSGSESKLPAGCLIVTGNALEGASYEAHVRPGDVFVHLVGVAHPGPGKERAFVEIDKRSAEEAIRVAASRGANHFVYVSVAQPAPVMKAYVDVRMQCESLIRQAGLAATILRPWYVLGPGHRWPLILAPFYYLAEHIPATRKGARRLGLVTIGQMAGALAAAVDSLPTNVRVLEVPDIRESARTQIAHARTSS